MVNDDKAGVYKIVFNNKIYVGSTTNNFKTRWAAHLTGGGGK